ncbi:MAG TPA: retropepsin-like aspartic protease [Kofleriaceae bacterium]|nr:retropepsin-like aspartic protease [Kofleriaceae bacterium]
MKRALVVLGLSFVGCSNPNPPHTERPVVMSGGATVTRVAPDTLPVLDAWANAMGGRAAISSIRAVHAKGSYERGGMRGTIELWETASGQRREEIIQGPLRELRVFDGTRGWLVDRNREVRELAAFELDDQMTLAFIGAHAALLTDRRAGDVKLDGDKVVLAPDGSRRPASVWLDRGTHLPDHYEKRDGERTRKITWSDWNPVGNTGAKLPWSQREENGNPNDAVTIHWTKLEAATPPDAAFAQPADRDPDMSLASEPVTVPIEAVYGDPSVTKGGLIFVKVSINDQPMSFILDTGAEATVLNSSRVSKLGLQGVGTFATGAGGGDVVLSYVPGVTTKVGGATVSNQIVAAILLDDIEKMLGRPLDGILGYDFLSRFVIEIDYANQQMRLFDRTKYHHTGSGKPIAITLEDSTPFFDASVEIPKRGLLAGHFVLDTGCLCDVQLFTPFVDANNLLAALPDAKQSGMSAGAGGQTKEVSASIPSIHIGDVVVKDVRADLARDTFGAMADPESTGLIGGLTFGRFTLVLDYKSKQVFLDPAK